MTSLVGRSLFRFLLKFEIGSRERVGPCWPWRASRTSAGYGQFRHNGRPQLAHRLAYETFVGPIPEGMTIDHLCRNRVCVNPFHMEIVTLAENSRRGAVRERCKNGHLLAESAYIYPDGTRECHPCKIARCRDWRARAAA